MTSSTQGEHGTLYASAYSASKWAIIGLMKSAALELGRYKITVNALVPGLIDTPLTRHEERYAQAIQVAGETPTGVLAADEETARVGLARHSPLGVPWINPVDVAPVVVFLASCRCRHGFRRHLRRDRGRQCEHHQLMARKNQSTRRGAPFIAT